MHTIKTQEMKKEHYLEMKAKVDAYEKVKADMEKVQGLINEIARYHDLSPILSSHIQSMTIHLAHQQTRTIPVEYAKKLHDAYVKLLVDDIYSLEKNLEEL